MCSHIIVGFVFTHLSVYHILPINSIIPFLFLLHPHLPFSPGIFIFLASVSLHSQEFWLACTPTLSLGALLGFQLICGEKNCNIITIYSTCLINFLLNYGMTWTSAEDKHPRAAEGPEVFWVGGEVPGNPACWKWYHRTICAGMTLCFTWFDFYHQYPTGLIVSLIIPMNPWIVCPPFARLHPFDPPVLLPSSFYVVYILMSWPLCWESTLHLCQVLKRRL